jgi:4-amino-4-deoxy-L-arabinose transferase-like glycosyltransferase
VDVALQVLLVWLVVRALRTGRHGLWLIGGAVLGLGLLNKQLPAFLAVSLVVGTVLSPAARPALRSAYPYLAGVVAAAAWLPTLWWQARHGWPQLTLAGQIREEYGQVGERIGFAGTQFVLFGVGSGVLWVTGVVRLLRDPGLGRFRPLAWAWVTLMVVFAVTAGQVYYAAGIYPALIAAGAVAAERWPRRRLLVAWTAVGAVVMLPASLPVLPPRILDDTVWSGLAEPLRESVGWPGLAEQVAAVRRSLPEAQRATAVVVTSNYGEAGGIEEYGPALGVPRPAYSGHNGFAAWGPPPANAGPVILVWQGDPSPWFAGCTPRGRVVTGVDNEEGEEATVYLCTGPVGDWAQVWPRLTRLRA